MHITLSSFSTPLIYISTSPIRFSFCNTSFNSFLLFFSGIYSDNSIVSLHISSYETVSSCCMHLLFKLTLSLCNTFAVSFFITYGIDCFCVNITDCSFLFSFLQNTNIPIPAPMHIKLRTDGILKGINPGTNILNRPKAILTTPIITLLILTSDSSAFSSLSEIICSAITVFISLSRFSGISCITDSSSFFTFLIPNILIRLNGS